ncbi:hypothetical protein [Campylobacter sp. US33a]|uniref:hypothetical protein n=1 Tax=Campylobacter sp. US33a TaxID=2498120 RepID=UPI00106742A6|nr:hypothetical protein [Campylobacter sp. US33a]TEY00722.1 hypothetical protein ELQ16_08795 [Campylobacter sp. US33a]
MGELSSKGEQLIATAYTFGATSLVFAVAPFLIVIIKGLIDHRKPDRLPSSIFSVILFAFLVHTISCILFLLFIKIADAQSRIYGSNYFQEKVFPLFWESNKQSVLSMAGAGDNIVAEGSFVILYTVQTIRDWSFIILPILVLSLGSAYGAFQSKKDTYRQGNDYLTTLVWTIVSTLGASLLFIVWAKIAEIALFIPNGETIIGKMQEAYRNMILN